MHPVLAELDKQHHKHHLQKEWQMHGPLRLDTKRLLHSRQWIVGEIGREPLDNSGAKYHIKYIGK